MYQNMDTIKKGIKIHNEEDSTMNEHIISKRLAASFSQLIKASIMQNI